MAATNGLDFAFRFKTDYGLPNYSRYASTVAIGRNSNIIGLNLRSRPSSCAVSMTRPLGSKHETNSRFSIEGYSSLESGLTLMLHFSPSLYRKKNHLVAVPFSTPFTSSSSTLSGFIHIMPRGKATSTITSTNSPAS